MMTASAKRSKGFKSWDKYPDIRKHRIKKRAFVMITFQYDDDGNVVAYKDGKFVGYISMYGNDIKKEPEPKVKTNNNDGNVKTS